MFYSIGLSSFLGFTVGRNLFDLIHSRVNLTSGHEGSPSANVLMQLVLELDEALLGLMRNEAGSRRCASKQYFFIKGLA